MRQEQIIAAVTRVVITAIREMEDVVVFARATCLHLWQQRKPLGTPNYPGSLSDLSRRGNTARDMFGNSELRLVSKHGGLPGEPMLLLASCPAGSDLG